MTFDPYQVPTVIPDLKKLLSQVEALNTSPRAARIISLVDGLVPLDDETTRELRTDLNENHPDSALQTFEDALAKGDATSKMVASQLVDGEHGQLIVESLRYYSKLGIDDYKAVSRIVNSFYRYGWTTLDPKGVWEKQYVRFMKVIHLVDTMSAMPKGDPTHPLEYDTNDDNWTTVKFRNPDLAAFIINTPIDAEELAGIITKHGVTEPNTIIGIREGVLPAIADGNIG